MVFTHWEGSYKIWECLYCNSKNGKRKYKINNISNKDNN